MPGILTIFGTRQEAIKLAPVIRELQRYPDRIAARVCVADHVSDLHFTPTEQARQNLLAAGISDATIHVTGNPVIDALLEVASWPWEPPPASPLYGLYPPTSNLQPPTFNLQPSTFNLQPSTFNPQPRTLLVTAHRRESFGRPLMNICSALRTLARRGDVHVVYPVHRNPNVWDVVHAELGNEPGVTLLPPVDYRELVYLLQNCTLVLTDSGGIQEEAPSLGKPVLVLREVTERPEGVEAGTARVVGTDPERIIAETTRLLDDPATYAAMAQAANPYGDGHAAERIVAALLDAQT